MDPASAIGLAASILTFVDFAWDLVEGAAEIYRSPTGTSDENARLEDVIDDLESLAESLQDGGSSMKTRAEKKIKRLAQDCQEDAEELLSLLSKLRATNKRSVWSSLMAKWKSILKKEEITELKGRLQEHRSDILLNLTIIIQEDQSALGSQLKQIQNECQVTRIDLTKEVTSIQATLLDTLSKQSACDSMERSNIVGMLDKIQTLVADIPIQHRVLRQLVFESMESRWNQIPDAEPDTCRWLLYEGYDSGVYSPYNWYEPAQDTEDARYRKNTRNSFLDWLRTGDGVLHISGNAGSGKSTLIKFIGRQEKTRQELEVWAAGKELIFGEFYFWNAGSKEQRTLPGLYRSILFQVLGQCPALIEKVFPVQLRTMKGSRGDALVERAQSFTDQHIQNAFDLLLHHTSLDQHKIFLIIDGLDEYEGNRLAHEALANKLRGWTNNGDVKLLVSSRPWPELLEPLKCDAYPATHLHILNRLDIRTYCMWRFQNDWEAHRWPKLYQHLVMAIVQQSQGVFLWAHIVVENLLQGIRQGDSFEILEAKILEAPSDIDALYDKLREPIEKSEIDRTISNRMLLLAARNPFNTELSAMALSWLEDGAQDGLLDPEFPAETTRRPYREEEVARRLDRVVRRVDGLARGLLQIVWPYRATDDVTPSFKSLRVQFCHRTARDYLLHNECRYKKLLASFPNFEETDPYGRICLAEVIFDSNPDHVSSLYDLTGVLGSTLRQEFEPKTMRKFEAILGPKNETLWHCTFTGDSYEQLPPWDKSPPPRVSFVQHAAYHGFDRFVLSEVDKYPAEELSTPGTSILLSAMQYSIDLGLDLLKMKCGFDLSVEIYPGLGKEIMTWPAWALLLGMVVARSFRHRTDFLPECGLPILRATHEHSVAVGQPVHIILKTVSPRPEVNQEQQNRDGANARVNTEVLLRLFEWLVEGEARGLEQGREKTSDGVIIDFLMAEHCQHLHKDSFRDGQELKVVGVEFKSQIIAADIPPVPADELWGASAYRSC